MESLEAKKVRLLARRIMEMFPWTSYAQAVRNAESIISLLEEIEQAYWVQKQEMDSLTHVGEKYADD